MSKAAKWISLLLFLVLLALLGVYAALRIPYLRARNAMPARTTLTLRAQADGTTALEWDRSDTADGYYVLVSSLTPDADGQTPCLFSALCTETRCVLPSRLPENEPVRLDVWSRRLYRSLGRQRTRLGDAPASVACYLNPPKVENLSAAVDAATAKVYLGWTGWQGDAFRLSLRAPDGSLTPLREQQRVGAELQCGGQGDLPIPAQGETLTFVLEGFRESGALRFYGLPSEAVSVTREDFLGRELAVVCAETGENRYSLTWNETKGARYQIRRVDPATGAATVLAEIPADGERRFETGWLRPYEPCWLEVAALGGEVIEGSDYAAAPARVELEPAAALTGATVWSLRDMDICSDPELKDPIGVMQTARAYCVLGEEGDSFRIGTPTMTGYVSSSECMINLPDYIGDLCSYDITNSYDSLYMVHGFGIPQVTGTVVSGYEQVFLGPDEQLVPLLYPTAKKLIAAAEAMRADGYRIRICDSFRPNRATRSIYDLTERIMNDPIPARTYTGAPVNDLPTVDGDETLTYAKVMTNAYYGLGSFLAAGGSMHNFGVAIDMTMETAADRAELTMQTAMHDLSCYSAISRNNANANLLRGYMLAAGFGGLTSEWWHFQDNEIFASVHPANRWAGVTPEGWRRDDGGWRYRLADGTYCRSEERTIDGTAYRFDENGYAASPG